MNKTKIKTLLRYLKGTLHLPIISIVLMLVELLVTFHSPMVLSVAFDSVLDTKPLNTPWSFNWFIEAVGGVEVIRKNLWILALATIALQAVRGILQFLGTYINNQASERSVKRLRDRFYAHVQKLPYQYHIQAATGDLIQRATSDIETIRRFVSGTMLELVRTVLLFILGTAVMTTLNWKLTFITQSMAPIIVGTSLLYFKRIQALFQRVEEADSEVFTMIQENLTGTRVVRAFGRQKFELEKFTKGNLKLKEEIVKLNNMFAYLWSSLDFVSGIQISLVSIFGILFTVDGELTVGQYSAFMTYVFIFLWPLRSFGRVLSDFGRSLISVGRIEEVLSEQEEKGLEEGAEPDLRQDIVFTDLDFAYEGVEVLHKLNMVVRGGQTVAILGGTGSGKSTLVHLLQRLYDYQGGSITIDGVELSTIKKSYLRSRVGIVLQEPFLYSKTILENIGIKMEKPDLHSVQEAARIASIHEDIEHFERGYDTIVGERGVTLSGGQKQRVAIARALINQSDILIFDDSLSAVDSKTDAKIREQLSKKRRGTTTFIISHRISTLMQCDRIFVLHNGRIEEEGTHEELLSLGGIYSKTYEIQSAQAE